MSPSEGGSYYFETLYLVLSDQTPIYNQADFSGSEWLAPDTLLMRLESGETAKVSLLFAVKKLKQYLAQQAGNQ